MSLALGLETVIFSPARRASRKILERIVEFIRILDCGHRIIEFNQEVCRVRSFNGKNSLIRSFPSKVGVTPPFNVVVEPNVWDHRKGGMGAHTLV